MRKTYSAFYVMNIVFQSIFTILFNVGTALLLSWLFVEKLGAPDWLYAVLIILGVLTGLISMVRFILSSMTALDRLEKANDEKRRKNRDEQ